MLSQTAADEATLADPCCLKLYTRKQAVEIVAGSQGKRVVFTNGVFDLLHRGHVRYLEAARALGDLLVVGLNSDASVRRLGKGPGRPINGERDRACVLGGLACVNLIVLFDESTPLRLIESLRPHVYVKAADYDVESLAEAALVSRWGGRALALQFEPGVSTTGIVERIAAGRAARRTLP